MYAHIRARARVATIVVIGSSAGMPELDWLDSKDKSGEQALQSLLAG
jgi:hypothetical protein